MENECPGCGAPLMRTSLGDVCQNRFCGYIDGVQMYGPVCPSCRQTGITRIKGTYQYKCKCSWEGKLTEPAGNLKAPIRLEHSARQLDPDL
jgi:hypothetical protein